MGGGLSPYLQLLKDTAGRSPGRAVPAVAVFPGGVSWGSCLRLNLGCPLPLLPGQATHLCLYGILLGLTSPRPTFLGTSICHSHVGSKGRVGWVPPPEILRENH